MLGYTAMTATAVQQSTRWARVGARPPFRRDICATASACRCHFPLLPPPLQLPVPLPNSPNSPKNNNISCGAHCPYQTIHPTTREEASRHGRRATKQPTTVHYPEGMMYRPPVKFPLHSQPANQSTVAFRLSLASLALPGLPGLSLPTLCMFQVQSAHLFPQAPALDWQRFYWYRPDQTRLDRYSVPYHRLEDAPLFASSNPK